MNEYLVVIERGDRNFSAYAPDVPGAVATGGTLEQVRERMAEALAIHLEGEPWPRPRVLTRAGADQHAREELGAPEGLGASDKVTRLAPAVMNSVSLEAARAIDASGLTQAEVAARMGTTQSAISRLVDPFYWGHSVDSLRRLANALEVRFELHFTSGRRATSRSTRR